MRPPSSLNFQDQVLSARSLKENKGINKHRPYSKRKAVARADVRANDSPIKMKLSKKAVNLVTKSYSGLKLLIKSDDVAATHSRIKAPQVRLTTPRASFHPTSFHVTGFELQQDYKPSRTPTPLPLADSNLSFSCYNSEILNYRLFKAPPASVFKTQKVYK